MKTKRYLFLLFIFTLIFISSCSSKKVISEEKEYDTYTYTFKQDADMSKINGYPWIDFSRPGAIKMVYRPSLKDDFYGYVNYDELNSLEINKEVVKGGIYEAENIVSDNIEYLLKNNSNSDYAKALSRIYNIYSTTNKDLEKAYIKAKIDEIMSINTKDGIYDYIFSQSGMENPSAPFHMREIDGKLELYSNTSNYDFTQLLALKSLNNGDGEIPINISKNCLMKYGFSRNEANNISQAGINADYEYLVDYLIQSDEEGTLKNSFYYDEGYSALYNYLSSLGYSDDTMVRYSSGVSSFIRFACYEDNIEIIKSVLAYRLGYTYKICLSINDFREIMFPIFSEISKVYDAKTLINIIFADSFTNLVDRAYIDEFLTDEDQGDNLKEIVNKIVEEYKLVIDSQKWLSDQSNLNLKLKLENLNQEILYPDYLKTLPSFDDNSSDLVAKYLGSYTTWMSSVNKDIKPNTWITSITFANAAYMPTSNSIVIYAGLLSNPKIYNENMTTEEMLAGVGFILAHEISHAFDASGIYYDYEGHYSDLLDTDESTSKFLIKEAQLVASLSRLKYKENKKVNGITVCNEAMADIGGMRIMLEIAKKTPGFDYKAFFEGYAKTFACMYNEVYYESDYLYNDSHLLPMFRVNNVLNEFQEFYDTFDIKSGDNMYKAISNRATIWD